MTNYSFYSIPLYYTLTLLPHNYAIYTIVCATNGKWNNASPRSSSWNSELQKSVPAKTLALFERLEAIHNNALENLPIFIGAVLAGNVAGLGEAEMNAFVVSYLALRVVYTGIYARGTSQKGSFVRTVVWFTNLILAMGVFVRAGVKMNG
jgi:uncharacterized MAPEG superfamily protein